MFGAMAKAMMPKIFEQIKQGMKSDSIIVTPEKFDKFCKENNIGFTMRILNENEIEIKKTK